jgi:beta-lactamase regulating signal transducer with metallopeptidase domain
MRGFAVSALVLVALDLVLRSPATRVASALALPTAWLREWTDASLPLIPARAAAKPATATTASAPVLA